MSDPAQGAKPARIAQPQVAQSAITQADAELRRRVLDRSQSWLVQAPAGSGKTELLMQRYLACLAAVEQPESVLAITFTRKAASEMRSRILAALQRASVLREDGIAGLSPHERRSLELSREVLEVSGRLGWNILSNPARLQVRTLDSFCEAVAQRAPLKGHLGGVAQVTEDAKPLYEMAAQRVIDELAVAGKQGDAVAELLTHRDNRVGDVRELLAAMLAQREQWLHFLGRSDVFDPLQQQGLRASLESALAFAVEEELAPVRTLAAALLSAAQQHELFALMRYSAQPQHANGRRAGDPAEQLTSREGQGQPVEPIAAVADVVEMPATAARAAAASTTAAGAGQAHPLRDIAAWPPANADALPMWRGIAQWMLLSDGPTLRKAVNVHNGFPCRTQQERARRKRCMELLEHIRQLAGSEEFCEALHSVRRLPDPHYSSTQWSFMLALLELLPRAAAHLQLVFSEEGTIDFGEYARRALDAIGTQGDPSELGLQLGYRVRHVLIDEFQDTNRVQVDLLARLLATWDAAPPQQGKGGLAGDPAEMCSIFCVGDPMQSIYAFRQADLALYRQVQRDGIGGTQLQFGCLGQNFRSQATLVKWFNAVFAEIFRAASDLTNAVDYARAEATRPALDGGAVAIRGFAAADRAGEAKHLAECIQRELAMPVPTGSKPSTIALLVRARTHLPELVEALRAAGIRYRAVKTDRLSDRPLVRDLEALRTALTGLADRTAWLAVLRAPWCGLGLADLLELCRNDARSTVIELLRERRGRLSPEGQIAVARCLPVLEDALRRRGRSNLRALVESTWLRLGGPSCESDCAQAARDAQAYFALLDEHSQAGNLRDAKSFAAKLHELFAPADPAAGIRVEIMPIHQAKGLQWDVVFLPALERRTRQDDKRLLYWRPRQRGSEELLLLGPLEPLGKKKDRKAATIESYLRDLATDSAREELKRLFYVAATRARNRLYLSASIDPGKAPYPDSMLRLLWELPGMREQLAPPAAPSADDANAAGAERPAEDNASSPSQRLLRRLPSLVSPPRPEMPLPLDWSAPRASASSGEQHRFEWVGELLPRIGVVAHSFLQRIAGDGLPLWDAARVEAARPAIAAALANAGVGPGELEQGTQRVMEALRRTLEDERGRWLLSPHDDDRSELRVSAVIDGELQHVRIDRTFVDNGTRWLIDYKITEQLGGDPQRFVQMQVEKYRSDMQRYAGVLRALDFCDVSGQAPQAVRCALYLPLLGQFCEVEV